MDISQHMVPTTLQQEESLFCTLGRTDWILALSKSDLRVSRNNMMHFMEQSYLGEGG